MSKVYVTFEANFDFSSAESYGEIEFITCDDLSNIRSSQRNDKILSNIRAKINKFDPEEDWLVITGSPYINAAIFLMLGHRKINSVKVLRWDNRNFVYQPMYLELRREHIDDEVQPQEQ